jgi:hypothetical protein
VDGGTVRAGDRENCGGRFCPCRGGRINFLTDVPKTISSLRDIQGLQMDVPTDRLCVCLPPFHHSTLFLSLTQPERTSNDKSISRIKTPLLCIHLHIALRPLTCLCSLF